MLQTNIREGYKITTLEVIKLIEDLISYLVVATCLQLRDAQTPPVFREAAAAIIRYIIVTKLQHFGNKVKTKNPHNMLTLILSKTAQLQSSNMLTLILSETAQRQSLSIVSNRSTALITDKFSVASLTKLAILNNANVTLVDAVHYSVVIDALTMTLIKDNDDLLGTINSYIKLRRLRARCKTEAADSRYAKASRRRTKKDKDLEDSDTSSDVPRLRRRDRAAACARLAERKQLEKEAQLKKTRDEEELAKAKKEKEEKEAQEHAYILYFKELLSNNSGIFANAIGIGKTRAIVLATEVQNARVEGNAIEHNAVDDDDKLCPTKGERTFYCADPLALQFCFFSNSSPENIGRLTKEEAIEMRINTTNAISKALAAANKLVALQSYIILEANTPAVHPKATKHRLALLAAQFVIVCGFRKVDKHVFRAYNTISVTAQRTIIRKGGSYIEKRAILLLTLNSLAMAKQWRNMIANVKHDASEYESSHKDILEKEGLNKLEASRRVIFNCFEMQAIASYSALATLKAAQFKTYSSCKVKRFTLNSVKDLFTNLSKDYFLVREARAITKSSLNPYKRGLWCIVAFAWSIAFSGALYGLPLNANRWTRFWIFTFLGSGNALAQGLNDAWVSANAQTSAGRSIGLALAVMGSNLGGLAGQQMFRQSDAPRYQRGFLAILCLYVGSIVLTVATIAAYWWTNKKLKREYQERESRDDVGDVTETGSFKCQL
ncbi:hypothetical protein HBH52_006130 [Parastagonospora nodorum]|nr:hypothetical protein HBH52_006130 [Parastagonospora nodorum]